MVTALHLCTGLHPCTRRHLHDSAACCAYRQPDDVELNSALYMVCKAVSSLHSRGIVHGDLRPANIMWFSSSFAMKLVDFGRWSQKGMPTPLKLSLRYAAPEVRLSSRLWWCAVQPVHQTLCLMQPDWHASHPRAAPA